MAGRPFDTRLRVAGWLELNGPLHVGGLGADPYVDLPVAVDGRSRLYVPGTSLAGALRGWMTGTSERHRLGQLWGFVADQAGPDAGVPVSGLPEGADGQASRVVVRDGLLCEAADLARPLPRRLLEARTSVGIDRWSGTAAEGILYSRSVVPAGSYLRLELDVESTRATWDRDRARLAALLDALRAGAIPLGGAVSRGLGRVRLRDDVAVEEQSFADREGLLAFLRGGGRVLTVDTLRAEAAAAGGDAGLTTRQHLTVTVDWKPLAPVMVRADRAGAELDALPLTGRSGDGLLRLVIPGGSLKGALRAHAERILRTVARVSTGEPSSPSSSSARSSSARSSASPSLTGFHDQLRIPQLAPAWALFGEPPRMARQRAAGDEPRPVPWGRGALLVDDCVSAETLDASQWERLLVEKTMPADLRGWLSTNKLEQADHVAIDRWTGGAADKLLFTVLEPWAVAWQPITMTLDLSRLGDLANPPGESADLLGESDEPADAGPAPDVVLALLLLVLRDLEQGRLPLGQGVNRGFGDVEATVLVRDPAGADQPLADFLSSSRGTRVKAAWRDYCASLDAAAASEVTA